MSLVKCYFYSLLFFYPEYGLIKKLIKNLPFQFHVLIYFARYYGPSYKLHISEAQAEDKNNPEMLQRNMQAILENLRQLEHAPNAGLSNSLSNNDQNIDFTEIENAMKDSKNPESRISSILAAKILFYF